MARVFVIVALVVPVGVAVGTASPAAAATGDLYGRGARYTVSTYEPHFASPGFGPSVDVNRVDGDCNRPVFAPGHGRVDVKTRVASGSTYGNSIIWKSVDGRERILVAHLSTIVKTGNVRGGDLIARAGATGKTSSLSSFDSCNGSRGAHLHVERSVNGKPAPVILSGRKLKKGAAYSSKGPLLSSTGGVDGASWVLTNSLSPDRDTRNRIRFRYGSSAYVPVVGNWDGYRGDNAGVFQPSTGKWVLTNSLSPDKHTKDRIRFRFGNSSYVPVAGNWDGFAGDNPGVFQPSTGKWVLTNSLSPDKHTNDRIRFRFGNRSYTPVVGNWDGYPGDNPGVVN